MIIAIIRAVPLTSIFLVEPICANAGAFETQSVVAAFIRAGFQTAIGAFPAFLHMHTPFSLWPVP